MISKYEIDWNVPDNIDFFISNNQTGLSKGLYKKANFSFQVGESRQIVQSNIDTLKVMLNLDNITFMNQTHSNVTLQVNNHDQLLNCDGVFTMNKNISCAVLTADCIPMLVTDKIGSFIGCIHIGWRGLKRNIIENFFKKLSRRKKTNFKVLIGPCIGFKNYEVSEEIFHYFKDFENRFSKNKSGNYNMDIRNIACDILSNLGITDVTISTSCTYTDDFYSYRRHKTTGRFISLIWFKNDY